MEEKITSQGVGSRAEVTIGAVLRRKGFQAVRAPYMSPYDLVVDCARVEVKCARPSKSGTWKVNIHRHGVLKEDRVDAYVIQLLDIPGADSPMYLVFKAPLGVMTKEFSFRSLVSGYSDAIDNWGLLHEICKTIQAELLEDGDAVSCKGKQEGSA
jgi:hypothetical protein